MSLCVGVQFELTVSDTSRPPKAHEVQGTDYFFRSKEYMEQGVKDKLVSIRLRCKMVVAFHHAAHHHTPTLRCKHRRFFWLWYSFLRAEIDATLPGSPMSRDVRVRVWLQFLECVSVNGHMYGTTLKAVQKVVEGGKFPIVALEGRGVRAMQNQVSPSSPLFVLVCFGCTVVLAQKMHAIQCSVALKDGSRRCCRRCISSCVTLIRLCDTQFPLAAKSKFTSRRPESSWYNSRRGSRTLRPSQTGCRKSGSDFFNSPRGSQPAVI